MKFTSEMFSTAGCCAVDREIAKSLAQDAFNEWLESAPKVRGFQEGETRRWIMDQIPSAYDTHTARLVCIDPIVKKECEHRPHQQCRDWESGHLAAFVCRNCGCSLEPTGWKVKE